MPVYQQGSIVQPIFCAPVYTTFISKSKLNSLFCVQRADFLFSPIPNMTPFCRPGGKNKRAGKGRARQAVIHLLLSFECFSSPLGKQRALRAELSDGAPGVQRHFFIWWQSCELHKRDSLKTAWCSLCHKFKVLPFIMIQLCFT